MGIFLTIGKALKKAFYFYYDGFRNLNWVGKRVWVIILIKAFIMFAILKIFFFKDFLNSKFSTEEEKSKYIIEQLTK